MIIAQEDLLSQKLDGKHDQMQELMNLTSRNMPGIQSAQQKLQKARLNLQNKLKALEEEDRGGSRCRR